MTGHMTGGGLRRVDLQQTAACREMPEFPDRRQLHRRSLVDVGAQLWLNLAISEIRHLNYEVVTK